MANNNYYNNRAPQNQGNQNFNQFSNYNSNYNYYNNRTPQNQRNQGAQRVHQNFNQFNNYNNSNNNAPIHGQPIYRRQVNQNNYAYYYKQLIINFSSNCTQVTQAVNRLVCNDISIIKEQYSLYAKNKTYYLSKQKIGEIKNNLKICKQHFIFLNFKLNTFYRQGVFTNEQVYAQQIANEIQSNLQLIQKYENFFATYFNRNNDPIKPKRRRLPKSLQPDLGLKKVHNYARQHGIEKFSVDLSIHNLKNANLPYLKSYKDELEKVKKIAYQQKDAPIYYICTNKIAILSGQIQKLENLSTQRNERLKVHQFMPQESLDNWDVKRFLKKVPTTQRNFTANVENGRIEMGVASTQLNQNTNKVVKVYFGDRVLGGAVIRRDRPNLQEETGVDQSPIILLMLAHYKNSVHYKNEKDLLKVIEGTQYVSNTRPSMGKPIYVQNVHKTLPIKSLNKIYGQRMEKKDMSEKITQEIQSKPLVDNKDGHLFLAAPRNYKDNPNHLVASYQIFQTAYTGFKGIAVEEIESGNYQQVTIESGILGCGVFNNDIAVSIASQYLAAKLAGVNITFKILGQETYSEVQNIVENMDAFLAKHPLNKNTTNVIKYLNFIVTNKDALKNKGSISLNLNHAQKVTHKNNSSFFLQLIKIFAYLIPSALVIMLINFFYSNNNNT